MDVLQEGEELGMIRWGFAAALAISLALVAAPAAGAKTAWLCKPGLRHNPCTSSMTAA